MKSNNMEKNMSDMIKRIESLMIKKGLNRKELANITGVNIHNLHNILQGKAKEPPASKLEPIAYALGVDIPFLLYGKSRDPFSDKRLDADEFDGILYAVCMEEGVAPTFVSKFTV